MNKGIPIVKLFGQKTAHELAISGKRTDLLVGNNVPAHVPDLNNFVKGMKILLNPKGVANTKTLFWSRGSSSTKSSPHLPKQRAFDQKLQVQPYSA